MQKLCAIYDLRVLPATFDIADFMVVALAKAFYKYGKVKSKITPVIICGKSRRLSIDYSKEKMQRDVDARIHRIMIPALSMLPFLNPPLLISENDEEIFKALSSSHEIIFPIKYCFLDPQLFKYYKPYMWNKLIKGVEMRFLKVPESDLDFIETYLKKYIGSEKPIVICERTNLNHIDKGARASSVQYLNDLSHKICQDFPVIFLPDFHSTTRLENRR